MLVGLEQSLGTDVKVGKGWRGSVRDVQGWRRATRLGVKLDKR